MSPTFELKVIGKYQIVVLRESLKDAERMSDLKKIMETFLDEDKKFIAINLENTEIIHSYFIKILTINYKKLRQRKGRLCVIGANGVILNLMQLLNIDKYITVYPSEEAFSNSLSILGKLDKMDNEIDINTH